jgi:uncharacterized protein
MSAYFLDSSGLVKRFVKENCSAFVINLIKPSNGHTIYLARLTSVEVVSAITRRKNIGSLSLIQANKAIARFERSLQYRYAFVEIDEKVTKIAIDLAKLYGLRGYDAIQLATALQVNRRRLTIGHLQLLLFRLIIL